jgi:hypothetical protein
LLPEKTINETGAEDFLTDEQNQMIEEYLSGQQLTVNYEGKKVDR